MAPRRGKAVILSAITNKGATVQAELTALWTSAGSATVMV